MRAVFCFFRSRYRYSHVGKLFAIRRSGALRFVPVVGIWALLLEPVIHGLAKWFHFLLVYTDKEFPGRRGTFRLWWNTPEELGEEYINRVPLMVCGNPIQELPRCQFYPVLGPASKTPGFHGARVVYMGEIELPAGPGILAEWQRWRDLLLNDLAMITQPDFWKRNFPDMDFCSRYACYRAFSNMIRYECVLAVQRAGISVELYGTQWRSLGLPAHESMYDARRRRELYRGNICLDFGSKSGSDSLHQRSIEIIENDGLLIQVRRADSNRIHGQDLAAAMSFNRVDSCPALILGLINDRAECVRLRALLGARFAKNMNMDRHAENSLAAVMANLS